ncbi:MAG: hypothetical protein R2774_15945 [Saprospiraceae bacterium]
MSARVQNMMLNLKKVCFVPNQVKAKMNGSYASPALTDFPQSMVVVYVEISKTYHGCFINYFLTQTHLLNYSELQKEISDKQKKIRLIKKNILSELDRISKTEIDFE